MLQYSFTISLGFPALLGLFVASLLALALLIRYRYLARYTQLKESALPLPSPPTLATELSPLAMAGLSDRHRSSSYPNYLDDFLSAIRIFGYLEKPVFHELSRHLQTRRLAAGETLDIGGGDFWCVVEGKVQVVSIHDESRLTTSSRLHLSPLALAPPPSTPRSTDITYSTKSLPVVLSRPSSLYYPFSPRTSRLHGHLPKRRTAMCLFGQDLGPILM